MRQLFILILCLFAISAKAQRLTHDFQNTSLSEALIWINNAQDHYKLNFIFDGCYTTHEVLVCGREELIRRWKNDHDCEWRTDEWLDVSLKSLPGFVAMEHTIDTDGLSVEQIAERIMQ